MMPKNGIIDKIVRVVMPFIMLVIIWQIMTSIPELNDLQIPLQIPLNYYFAILFVLLMIFLIISYKRGIKFHISYDNDE